MSYVTQHTRTYQTEALKEHSRDKMCHEEVISDHLEHKEGGVQAPYLQYEGGKGKGHHLLQHWEPYFQGFQFK